MTMTQHPSTATRMFQWLLVIALVYLLLVAVATIGSGFKLASGGHAKEIFEFATNPFIALMVGLMATALVQSSSTVTSIIVGLVAGGLPIPIAIPMIMGANIGTTITNTIVSLGHIREKEEFKSAFSAATVHDFFNLLAVLIFLPLEMMFGFLEKFGAWLTQFLVGGDSLSIKGFNFIKPLVKPITGWEKEMVSGFAPEIGGSIMIAVGICLIFAAVLYMGKLLKLMLVGRAKEILHNAIGHSPFAGISSGAFVTVLVQSSSTTTSLMVPLVGSGVFKMRDIYPFMLGANIGTTVTAILAATAVSGEFAFFAIQIAVIHFLFNFLGVLVIFSIPFLREIPLRLAEKMAHIGTENKSLALGYIAAVFFAIPGVLIWATA